MSDSSEEMDNTDDSLEVVYTGMDAGELEEVSSCDNLSDSNVSNLSGRGNKSVIDPSFSGTSRDSVGVSRHHVRLTWVENEQGSSGESEETESCVSDGDESESEENSTSGKTPKHAKTSQKYAQT